MNSEKDPRDKDLQPGNGELLPPPPPPPFTGADTPPPVQDGSPVEAPSADSGGNPPEQSAAEIPDDAAEAAAGPAPEPSAAGALPEGETGTAGESAAKRPLLRRLCSPGAIAIIAVAALLVALFAALPKDLISIDPTSTTLRFDASDFSEKRVVYLEGAGQLSAAQVQESLRISPAVSFNVYEGAGRFEIRLLRPEEAPYTLEFTHPSTGESARITVSVDRLEVTVESTGLEDYPVDEPLALLFSEEVTEWDLRSSLLLEPHFEYDVAIEKNRAYITPTGHYGDEEYRDGYRPHLAHNTDYTITISGGLASADETLSLAEDFVIRLHTRMQEFEVAPTKPEPELLALEEDLAVQFLTLLDDAKDSALAEQDMEIALYRFPDLEHYLAHWEALSDTGAALGGLEQVAADTHRLGKGLTTWGIDNPGLGAYLVEAQVTGPETGEEFRFRKAFAVTDLSVYIQTNNAQSLAWVHSSATGLPLSGYELAFLREDGHEAALRAVTDEEGVSIFDYVDEQRDGDYGSLKNPARILTLRNPEGELVYVDNTRVLNTYSRAYISSADRYYSFLHTDRPLYKPTDEVQFWGYIQAYRGNEGPMPQTALLVLGEDTVNQTAEVPIQADGTFTGSIPIESLRSAQYRLAVKVESAPAAPQTEEDAGEGPYYQTLEYTYIQVKEYEKPAYLITYENDREYYRAGDDVTVTITPTFYDGTPMPDYDLEVKIYDRYYGDVSTTRTVATDSSGVASITFPAQQKKWETTGWQPIRNRYVVRIDDDGESIVMEGSYIYFPTDLLFSGSASLTGGNAALTLDAHAIDLSFFEAEEGRAYEYSTSYSQEQSYLSEWYDDWKGARRDLALEVYVHYYYYDTDDVYQTGDETYTASTAGGPVTLSDLFPEGYDPEGYGYLEAVITGTDSRGNLVRGRYSWYNGEEYRRYVDENEGPKGYNFAVTDSRGENVLGPYSRYSAYSSAAFEPGEQMNFRLQYRGDPAENRGTILYTILQDKIVERGYVTGNTLQLTQSVYNANSINLVAAYFDGKKVWPVRDTVITLNRNNMGLEVEVTPDRESYQPGDTVHLAVKVTDGAGNGVSGSAVIGVVDESLFALQEQNIHVLSDLYRDFYFSHYDVKKYATTYNDYDERDEEENAKGDGGKGGGDNLQFIENLRKNFKDTALFQPVRTDAGGNASLTFTLPDNVTSWRVTGVAIGDNLFAGDGRTNFVTTIPFFLRPVISTKYIDGDDVAVLVQGHGVVLDEESVVDYLVTVTGDGVDLTLDASAKAYQPVELNFGKLPQGEYTIVAIARFGEYSDGVETTFAVINSNLELVISRDMELGSLADISALRYPVTVTFYDRQHEAYYSSISSLLSHYCMQASQRMSRFVAKRSLTQYMDPANIPRYIAAGNESASDMQNEDGGIGYIAGAASEPVLTAKVLIIARDQFDLEAMAAYFRDVLEEGGDADDVAASYLGLAVIGEPVAEEIRALLGNPAVTEHTRIYLIAALAYLEEGDAPELYAKHVAPRLTEGSGGVYYQSESPQGGSDDKLTAAAWIAASRLGIDKDADGIALFFAGNRWRISTLFECMIYVTHYDKEVLSTSLSYHIGGEERQVDLGLRGSYTVSLSRSEFEALSFPEYPANIKARAFYIGEPAEVDFVPSDKFSISRSIQEIGNNRYVITLTLDFEDGAPTGYYDISEWIPSSLRLYSLDKTNRNSGDNWYYSSTTEGQKIYYRVNRYGENAKQVTLRYTAQKVYDAEAVVDSAYVIHGDTGENNKTERSVLP